MLTYATAAELKAAPDYRYTARNDAQVKRALTAAKETIDGNLGRDFHPWTGTRGFDYPSYTNPYSRPWVLWLDANTLISVTSIVTGGVTLTAAQYLLRRSDGGTRPPYTKIEIKLDGGAAWGTGTSHQNAIQVTGLWGYRNDEINAGALTGALGVSGSANLTLDAPSGAGTVLRVDDERMIITDVAMIDTTINLAVNLTNSTSDTSVTVTDGDAFASNQTIQIDGERMLIYSIAGDVLTVKRAWDGTPLAAHTAPADVYALSDYTIERGALGTTAASHLSGATVYRWLPPTLIASLCVAEAINTIEQETSGYGRTVGSGDNEREARGAGLADLRRRAELAYGRRGARIGAI